MIPSEFIDLLPQLQRKLQNINHPDSLRISKEILQYVIDEISVNACNDDSIKQNTKKPAKKSIENLKSLISSQIDVIIEKLKNNMPWEYIKGSAEFCGYIFQVDKNVLIPRTDTEFLVYYSTLSILQYFFSEYVFNNNDLLDRLDSDKSSINTITIIDIGTGSGCIITSVYMILSGIISGSINIKNISDRIYTEQLEIPHICFKTNTRLITERDIFELHEYFKKNRNKIDGFINDLRKRNLLSKWFALFDFIGTDISQEALSIATNNYQIIKKNPILDDKKAILNSKNVQFIESNWLTNIPQSVFNKSDVFIISNPPYIPPEVYLKLDPSVKDHEPKLALVGNSDNLLSAIKQLEKEKQFHIKGIYFEDYCIEH